LPRTENAAWRVASGTNTTKVGSGGVKSHAA
jgi:hypothetical protein